jgi:hypothetical protein
MLSIEGVSMSPETREDQIARETRILRAFRLQADQIAHAIVNTDLPWIDITLRIEALRREAERLFPSKMTLFEHVYVRRFERLREQWREHP